MGCLVQMVMSQLMNNPQFNNMHIEMRDSPGFRYRYRNASPPAQQPPAMQGPPGRHSCASGPPPSALMYIHAEAFPCHPRMSASGQHLSSRRGTCRSTWRRSLSDCRMCTDGEWHLASDSRFM